LYLKQNDRVADDYQQRFGPRDCHVEARGIAEKANVV
jgi:hypothetical protein